MTRSLHPTPSLWARIRARALRWFYPWYVARPLRTALISELRRHLTELRLRTQSFDASAWERLRNQLGFLGALSTFDELVALVLFKIDVCGSRFPVRIARGGVARFGRGPRPRFKLDEITGDLPALDGGHADRMVTLTIAERDTRINELLATERDRARGIHGAALASLQALETRTRAAVESIGAAQKALVISLRQELDVEASLAVARENYAAAVEAAAISTAALAAARERGEAVDAAVIALENATARVSSLDRTVRGRSDAADSYRRRSHSLRNSIAGTLAQLDKTQTTIVTYLDDGQVEMEWLRVAQSARELELDIADVRKRVAVHRLWHLTPREEQREKTALAARISKQLIVTDGLATLAQTAV